MDGKIGHQAYPLDLRFLETPAGTSFYQAARRVECAFSNKPRLGTSTRAEDDPVQFCQEPSLSFASSTLQKYLPQTNTAKARLFVNFLGLLGPHGPMPLHLTEYVRDRELNEGDRTLARFLDIFNHRMISLFYRAWACNRPTISRDRPDEDRFSTYIGSFLGIGTDAFRDRDVVPDVAKLHYAGHFACQTRHAEGLRTIIAQYFKIKTTIREFIGEWISLPKPYHCRLGQNPNTATVGVNAIVGSRVWDCQQKFRIILGPMPLKDYERMLPGGKSYSRLKTWIRNYVGDALGWEVQLVLKAGEVPAVRLGQTGSLGWTTWLQSQPFERDTGDLILNGTAG